MKNNGFQMNEEQHVEIQCIICKYPFIVKRIVPLINTFDLFNSISVLYVHVNVLFYIITVTVVAASAMQHSVESLSLPPYRHSLPMTSSARL